MDAYTGEASAGDSGLAGDSDLLASTAATSDKVATSAEKRYVTLAIVLVLIGLMVGSLLQRNFHPDLEDLPQLVAGVSPFALLYVFAQSIERVIELVSPLLGGLLGVADSGKPQPRFKGEVVRTRNSAWREAVVAPSRLVNSDDPEGGTNAEAAVKAQHVVEQFRANCAVVAVGLAALLAMVASGYVGFFLLHLLGLGNAGGTLDLLVTGLAVGAGTKPLHDVISNLSKAKESKQDPKELQA
jgi:hypothetical protein